MANRFPLIANSSANQIQELAAGDNLDLTGSGISNVGNINASGISTLGNTVVGGGTTQLVVTGNARITGILTIGTSSITLDGSSNQVNVGTGVTLHHTDGVQVGGNNLHSTVLTVNQINASGVITATSFSGSGANLTGIAATTNVVTNSLVVSGITTVAAGSVSAPSITPTGDSNTGIFFPSADTIAFGEGGSEAARIDSSGRLLLGTSTTWANGNTDTPNVLFAGSTLNGVGMYRFSADGNWPIFSIGKSRNATVGSQTAVGGSEILGGIFFDGSDGTAFKAGATITAVNDQGGAWASGDCPTRLVFSTTADSASSPTERMRITNAGEVLIGTSTPVLNAGGLTAGSAAFASALRIHDGGSVGWFGNPTIRNNNGSGYLICMNGTTGGVGLTNGGTSWTSLSDENYKTDLTPIVDAATKVRSLRTVTGRYIDDDAVTSRSFLIAQDVEAVLPEAVSTADNGKKLLSYTDTIPLLAAALKEALEKIETLEAKVAALESA